MCTLFNKSRLLLSLVNVVLKKNMILTVASKNRTYMNSSIVSNISLFNGQCNFQISQLRYKSKDKKSNKGKTKIEVNLAQLNEVINVKNYEDQMQKCILILKEEYVKNLSLRSTTGAIDSLTVHLDGKEHTLQELAQIVRTNPKTVILKMAIFPQAIPAVIQALQKSGMNLNPQQDGTSIFIPVPKVTKEHRENLAKNAKALFVKCRDSIKDAQNKNLRDIKKQDNVSKDLLHSVQAQIGVIADKYVVEAEKVYTIKHAELLGKN